MRQFIASAAIVAAIASSAQATPLDDFVFANDPNYGWVDTGVVLGGKSRNGDHAWTGYVLNMTSGAWLTPEDSTCSMWWHHLVVVVPDKVDWTRNSTLWITGNNNNAGSYPSAGDEDIIIVSDLAMGTGSVTASLFQVPNEHCTFTSDPIQKSRTEDAIIAFTWDHFMRDAQANPDSPNAEWLVRLPMVRAVSRAMDTVTDFAKERLGYDLDYYTVAGASKRGWTTWLSAAVDQRVVAAIPVVLDAIKFESFMHHQWKAYGGWSFALSDYYDMDIMSWMDTPEMRMMSEIEDPYYYFDRLTMPKFVVNAVGDEFQMPDDWSLWINELPEPKHFIMVPNAEHSLATGIGEALPAMGTWIEHLLTKTPVPKPTWSISQADGSISLKAGHAAVEEASMWYAKSCADTTEVRRDFRFATADVPCKCGIGYDGTCANLKVLWQKETLTLRDDGTYYAAREAPAEGQWSAILVDLIYRQEHKSRAGTYGWFFDKPGRLEMTSEVSIFPNTYPYEDCAGGAACKGTLV